MLSFLCCFSGTRDAGKDFMMLEYSWLFGMNIDNLGTLKERRLAMQVVLLCYRES